MIQPDSVGHGLRAIAIEGGPILKIASLMDILNHSRSMVEKLPNGPSLDKELPADLWQIQKPTPVTPVQAAQITEKVSLLLAGRFPSIEDWKIKHLVSGCVQSQLNESGIESGMYADFNEAPR